MSDTHKNFAYSLVATAPSPASSGTSLVVTAGDGALFPAVPFNATIWPTGSQPTSTNAEIVRVTNIATDTFTITRTQESTSARTVVVGDQIAATITNLTLTDAQTDYMNLLGANTAGSTTASGSTIGLSGVNLTLSGTNSSQIAISAPATSSLSATGQVSISTNGSTISIGAPYPSIEYLEPRQQTNTSAFVPGVGSWYLSPFVAPGQMAGGRINNLISNTSTAGIAVDATSASFVTTPGHMGTRNLSYQGSFWNALYSQGTGTNTTRMESFWSNTFSYGMSNSITATHSGAGSTVVISNNWSFSYISEIGSDGAYTLANWASSVSATGTGTRMQATSISNAGSSIRNMLSDNVVYPVGLNTTISQGNYWMAQMYSTFSTVATTSLTATVPGMSQKNQVYIQANDLTTYRNWASTAANSRSQIFPGQGAVYTAASAVPPQYIIFSSDMATVAGNNTPYFNFVNQGITK